MSIDLVFHFVATLTLLVMGSFLLLQSMQRTATDVYSDLAQQRNADGDRDAILPAALFTAENSSEHFALIGCLTREEKKQFEFEQRLIVVGVAVAVMFVQSVVGRIGVIPSFLGMIFGISLGYIVSRRRYSRCVKVYRRDLEFHLPIVMERIVMAVQSGLDVIPALGALQQGTDPFEKVDPVTRLLGRVLSLTEAGLHFSQSLREVGHSVHCAALKHAFIHLATAHNDGGELLLPLREISDATQQYYQESVEEEIAALPIQATLPLLCTFAGLISIFVTAPLLQVLAITVEAMPK